MEPSINAVLKAGPNIRLVENNDQTKIDMYRLHTSLPLEAQFTTSFDSNPEFAKARATKQKWALIVTPRHNVLLIPTKPFASIVDYAQRVSNKEWKDMWSLVYSVRQKLQQLYGGYFYIETIGTDVPQLHIRFIRRPNQIYTIAFDANSVSKEMQAEILKIANHSKGWCGRFNCSIRESNHSKVTVYLKTPAQIVAECGSSFKDLSVTIIDPQRTRIFLNSRNWFYPPLQFRGTKHRHQMYHQYLIQHEIGHALFHIHDHDSEEDYSDAKVCSVMYQQTKGTSKCRPGISYFARSWIPQPQDSLQHLLNEGLR